MDKNNVNVEETQIEETQEQTETTENKEGQALEYDIKAILENPEFIKYMESHADKRVSSALSKKEKEYQAKLEEEKRKANMTVEELQTEKEKELAERENTLKQYELKLSKLDYFKEKNYNIELLDFVTGSDEDEIKSNSDKLIEVMNKAVEKVVQERLKTNPYVPPTGGDVEKIDISNMSMEEYAKHWQKQNK
ncbi:MAG: DUF4355 domain-containing protein [Bacilli bacterium]|nr:DUF4355 domain-containing protein [Bacilli bacterium]